jgi:putative ABC transport system permease protein
VGILQPTGTPVDRAVHVRLEAMEAMHVDWVGGAPVPGFHLHPEELTPEHLAPKEVTAALVGLKGRAAAFAVQRWVADFEAEALMAVLPGVAMNELWQVVGVVEQALLAITALVAAVSMAGLVATIMAGLQERRRELAVLRAVGASPRDVLTLLLLEGSALALLGTALGWAASVLVLQLLRGWVQAQWGVHIGAGWPPASQVWLMAGVLGSGVLASLLPAWRAYRLSLADGLSPKA